MLLRTQAAAYLVLAPKKATGKYAKPAKSVLISETCPAIASCDGGSVSKKQKQCQSVANRSSIEYPVSSICTSVSFVFSAVKIPPKQHRPRNATIFFC